MMSNEHFQKLTFQTFKIIILSFSENSNFDNSMSLQDTQSCILLRPSSDYDQSIMTLRSQQFIKLTWGICFQEISNPP